MKRKKNLKRIAVLIVVCGLMFFTYSCNQEKKYDVTMRIETSEGEYWIFTPDIEEMEVEIQYDGKERSVFMAKYNIPDHPQFKDSWITPSSGDPNRFVIPGGGLLYTDLNGKQCRIHIMKERGEYSYNCDVRSNKLKERIIILTINIA